MVNFNCQSTGSLQTRDLALVFFSYCPMKYKINSIKTLISRAYKICSSYPLLHIEFNLLKVFFKNNGFPTELVDRCISKYLSKLYERINVNSPEQNCSFYINFPYFGLIQISSVMNSPTFFGNISVILI